MSAIEQPIAEHLSLDGVQQQLSEIVSRVHAGKAQVIIEDNGVPQAVIISMETFQQILRSQLSMESRLRQFQTATRSLGEAAAQQGLTEEMLDQQVEIVRQRLHDQVND